MSPKLVQFNHIQYKTGNSGLLHGEGGRGFSSPVFGQTVNQGSRLCPPQSYQPPGFSDLATALIVCRKDPQLPLFTQHYIVEFRLQLFPKGQIISKAFFIVLNSSKKRTKNLCPKGQLIWKCLLGVIVSTKKPTNFSPSL